MSPPFHRSPVRAHGSFSGLPQKANVKKAKDVEFAAHRARILPLTALAGILKV
jgi:hypothetical protein